jgi:putative transposase
LYDNFTGTDTPCTKPKLHICARWGMYNQRIDYLHENPERAGFVKHPIDWKYSSAIDYYTEEGKGLLELVRLN